MELLLILKAVALGIIEGLTEFLPVSSTGHLIVFGRWLDFESTGKVFEIVIQLGAVLAIVYEYRRRFVQVVCSIVKGRLKDRRANRFVLNLVVAFLPAAVVGLLFASAIKNFLFNPVTVSSALIIGGIFMLLIEKKAAQRPISRVQQVDDMRVKDALVVGLAQILALIPGTSRSGSTIMGGMLWGLERKVATEFSFFLAVPVMISATAYDLLKHYKSFTVHDISLILLGFFAAFVSGLLAVRLLLRYVSHKNYVPFAWYRILFGGVILLIVYAG